MKVIFLCTANSARSILAEAIFRELVGKYHQVYSCGAEPSGQVNPHALAFLKHRHISTDGLYSKSYRDVPLEDALLVAVCPNAANEVCPPASCRVHKINMPLPDPAAPGLSDNAQQRLFREVGCQLNTFLLNLRDQLLQARRVTDVVSPSAPLLRAV